MKQETINGKNRNTVKNKQDLENETGKKPLTRRIHRHIHCSKHQAQRIWNIMEGLNKPLSKYPKLGREAGCTFCSIINAQPTSNETQQPFYSECISVQRLWTEIRDWAAGNHDAFYKKGTKY